MASLLACSLFVCLSTAAESPKEDTTKKAPAELQGAWKIVSLETNGEASDVFKNKPQLIINGDKMRYGGEDIAKLSVDAAASPKSIDLAFIDPKATYEGIWSLEKDTLRICFNSNSAGVKERPVEFTTQDKGNMRLLILERDRTKESDELEGVNGFAGLAMRFDKETNQIIADAVLDASPAKKAGFQKGDVIIKAGGAEAKDLVSVVEKVRQVRPGQEITFQVTRDGKMKEITLKVGVFPFRFLVQLN